MKKTNLRIHGAVDVTRRERTDVFDVKANKDLSC